jgi:hypothetical protein
MFGFLPHKLFTGHNAANTSGLSPRLWSRVTDSIMSPDGNKRLFLVGDDFPCMSSALSTGAAFTCEHPYLLFRDDTTNILCNLLADENCGVLALTLDAGCTAQDSAGFELGPGAASNGQLGQISDTAGAAFLTVFECRVKISSLVTGKNCFAVGLAGPAISADGGLIDTAGGPMANKSFIGFNILADDGDSMDFCYQGASQTRQDKITGVHVPVADTFVKLGFIYDPDAVASKRIAVYVDNVEQSTYVTATNIAAATFPDAEALTFALHCKNVAGSTALEAAIDWWAFAQVL